MFSYDRIGQLANQHHHEMLADARRRELRHQQDRPAPRTLKATRSLARRLAGVLGNAGAATA
jgi:hypothetical protein